MLDFYQWFPVDHVVEVILRAAAFCGLASMAVYTRQERREYEECSMLIEHQQLDLLATIAKNVAAEAMVISFRVNSITLYSDFLGRYNRYMGCASRADSFFVFSGCRS